jgi:hypothetical protein
MSLKQRLDRLEGRQDSGTASFWDYMLGDATEAQLDEEGEEMLATYLDICQNGPGNIIDVDEFTTKPSDTTAHWATGRQHLRPF